MFGAAMRANAAAAATATSGQQLQVCEAFAYITSNIKLVCVGQALCLMLV